MTAEKRGGKFVFRSLKSTGGFIYDLKDSDDNNLKRFLQMLENSKRDKIFAIVADVELKDFQSKQRITRYVLDSRAMGFEKRGIEWWDMGSATRPAAKVTLSTILNYKNIVFEFAIWEDYGEVDTKVQPCPRREKTKQGCTQFGLGVTYKVSMKCQEIQSGKYNKEKAKK